MPVLQQKPKSSPQVRHVTPSHDAGPQLSAVMAAAKPAAAGGIKDIAFLDADTCFWQLAKNGALAHGTTSAGGLPSQIGMWIIFLIT